MFTALVGTFVAATGASIGSRMLLETVSGSIPGQLSPYLDDMKLGLVIAVAPMLRSYIPM